LLRTARPDGGAAKEYLLAAAAVLATRQMTLSRGMEIASRTKAG
jgi:hypothetical protein